MRQVLAALLAITIVASPAAGHERQIFVFAQPFWINLHHFLYVLGRAENRAIDRERRAVAEAPKDQDAGLAKLTPEEQSVWRAAVTAYANTWSKKDLVFDSDAAAFTNTLVRAAGAPDDVLRRAESIYRKAWWPAHKQANDARINELQQLVTKYGDAVLNYITRVYQEPWPPDGYPVNVSGYTNWAGAYSTDNRLLVVSSLDKEQAGLAGLETVFHESMHQWDDAIDAKLKAAATRENKSKVPNGLSHGMVFYTAGEAVRSVAPGYVPYADSSGVWQRGLSAIKTALDADWKLYLDSPPSVQRRRDSLDAALDALLRHIQ